MTPSDVKQRREIYYRGRVQGVGFRYTSRHVAANYHLTGYVRNLPDGGVFLVAEGEAGQLESFLRAIDEQMGSYITHIESTTGTVTGEFKDFQIRY